MRPLGLTIALVLSACAFSEGSTTDNGQPLPPDVDNPDEPESDLPAEDEPSPDVPPGPPSPPPACADADYGPWMHSVLDDVQDAGASLDEGEIAELEALVSQRPCDSSSAPLYQTWIADYDDLLDDHDDWGELDQEERTLVAYALTARPDASGDAAVGALLDVHDDLRRRLDDWDEIDSRERTLMDALAAAAPDRSGADGYRRWLVSFEDAYDDVDGFGSVDPWERTILDVVLEVRPCVLPLELPVAQAHHAESIAQLDAVTGFDLADAAPTACAP